MQLGREDLLNFGQALHLNETVVNCARRVNDPVHLSNSLSELVHVFHIRHVCRLKHDLCPESFDVLNASDLATRGIGLAVFFHVLVPRFPWR